MDLLAREEGGYPGLQWARATSDPRWRGRGWGPISPMVYAVSASLVDADAWNLAGVTLH
jgi:hypothetical protein